MNISERASHELLVVRNSNPVQMDARQARHAAHIGTWVRVRRGVYVPADEWRDATSADRYLVRVHAVVQTRLNPPVLGYWSAAAVWGYPRIAPWPTDVHLVVPPNSGAHSKYGIRFHREHIDECEVVTHEGIALTSPARTLVDLARIAPFRDAVVAMDAALDPRRSAEHGRVHPAQLLDGLSASGRGSARASRAVAFADGRATNPGESLSRIAIIDHGFAPPQLQTEHPNPDGGRYFTDFEWPLQRVIGEFDGRGKYLKDELLGGRSPGEVVYDEKRREDHLRAEGNTVVRWGWRDLHEPGRLIALLSAAGVPFRAKTRTGRLR